MITGINHITLATSDINKSLNFYCEYLKFTLVAKWKKGAYLSAGDAWLCLFHDPMTKKKELDEYSHIAFSVDEIFFNQVRGIVLENNLTQWKKNSSEGDSLYLLDPNYNKIEIHCGSLESRMRHIKEHPYEDLEVYV